MPPPNSKGKSEIGLYGDTIEELDWSTGQILETLRKLKIDQNTLVIYTSDNGPWKLATNSWVKGNMNRRVGGFAHPLKGYKFSRFEGGMRVPTVMWWPGRIPAGKECSEVGASMDSSAHPRRRSPGPRCPMIAKIDGKNLLPLMEGRKGAKSPHEAFFYGTEAVRSGKWKLKGRELFDLREGYWETKNLASANPEVVKRLGEYLSVHKEDLAKNKRPAGGPPKQPRKRKK